MPRQNNPLPQLILSRALQAQNRLAALLWRTKTALQLFISPVLPDFISPAMARRLKFSSLKNGAIVGPPHGAWKTRWLKLRIPAAKNSERGLRHLIFDCQGEATLWYKNKPWAGLDVAHKSCPLPDAGGELLIELGLWQTGLWFPGIRGIAASGPQFESAHLGVRDPQAWETHWDLDGLLQLLKVLYESDGKVFQNWPDGYRASLESAPPLMRKLLRSLDTAVDQLDHQGLDACQRALKSAYRQFPAEAWQPQAALCGHAHIDLVWLWPERVTESKGIHTFATQLRLMERYPEFKFSQSQPALYRAIERLVPEQMKEIQRRIKQGRWEAMGALEVEPDNNLPCGESLARSLYFGQQKLASLRSGSISPLCWIPDVFGYSGALPQILKLGGVKNFFTTKMSWSQITKFPYSSFVWKGIDDSEVLTHLSPAGYCGAAEAWRMNAAIKEHRQADVHPELLFPSGWGDGGGGVTEEILERARRLKNLSGLPKSRWTKAEDFFSRLEKLRPKLPRYQGELYLEYHRGTYTTQSGLKYWHRALERALQTREAVRVALGQGAIPSPSWLRLAFAAFHDALPGSSIRVVNQALGDELKRRAENETAEALAELKSAGQGGKGYSAFNTLAFARSGLVELPGKILASVQAPALSSVPIEAGQSVAHQVKATKRSLDNGLIRSTFDAQGRLDSLSCAGGKLDLSSAAEFVLHADQPHGFDAWDIDHSAFKKEWPLASMGPLKIIESHPLRARLQGSCSLGKKSRMRATFSAEAGSPWLKITLEIDWRERHRLLKYHLATGYRGRQAIFGAPFGSVLRPQLAGTERDEAMWEVPASRWAAVTGEDRQGLAVVTEAKYGFSCKDGRLGLSLLRSPTEPDPEADQGQHIIKFAIGSYRAKCEGGFLSTAAEAESLYTPLLLAKGDPKLSPPFELKNLGSLLPSWVLPSSQGKGFIIRLHETSGHSDTAMLSLRRKAQKIEKVDFLERSLGNVKGDGGMQIAIPYHPYEIISLKIS